MKVSFIFYYDLKDGNELESFPFFLYPIQYKGLTWPLQNSHYNGIYTGHLSQLDIVPQMFMEISCILMKG